MLQWGTKPVTQACALTRNQTSDLLLCSQHSTKWATAFRARAFFFIILASVALPRQYLEQGGTWKIFIECPWCQVPTKEATKTNVTWFPTWRSMVPVPCQGSWCSGSAQAWGVDRAWSGEPSTELWKDGGGKGGVLPLCHVWKPGGVKQLCECGYHQQVSWHRESVPIGSKEEWEEEVGWDFTMKCQARGVELSSLCLSLPPLLRLSLCCSPSSISSSLPSLSVFHFVISRGENPNLTTVWEEQSEIIRESKHSRIKFLTVKNQLNKS